MRLDKKRSYFIFCLTKPPEMLISSLRTMTYTNNNDIYFSNQVITAATFVETLWAACANCWRLLQLCNHLAHCAYNVDMYF